MQWRIGILLNYTTRDGSRLTKGGKQTVIHRPVQKLIAFKIAERERSDEWEANNENETVVIQSKLNQTTAEVDKDNT